jgi:hypothetical protein
MTLVDLSCNRLSLSWIRFEGNSIQDPSHGNGPNNLVVLHHMALNAIQKEGSRGSLRGKFKRAGRDHDYLNGLLTPF